MTAPKPPWPVVMECHDKAPSQIALGHQCAQCDGGHTHNWVAWKEVPIKTIGIPVRCAVCGARKCDTRKCMLRRHHSEPHEEF